MFMRRSTASSVNVAQMALEAVQAKIMVADRDLNIIYINPSATKLMQEAEADLRQELPNFRADRLIGSNIDVFHRSPDHQRQMLQRLTAPHKATIRIGRLAFDLLVVQIYQDGARFGFVVEWEDARHRLLNLDYEAQINAIGRSQAIIAFAVDGRILTANDNFLKLTGYRLDEIEGRHHSIFVEPGFEKTQEYAELWDTLRRGEYRASLYRRIGKDGRPLWIEGSYNPIFDERGQVTKVVKFAIDSSAKMQLLGDLNQLISDVDQILAKTSADAEGAVQSAEQGSQLMMRVADSAQQIVASIGEIAQSMSRSRTAADSAFDQTVAVNNSTEALAAAAQSMTSIVGLIRNIAGQINLLALNATIEAARAGEAGKGFAVVASEVKNLAVQAAKATERIAQDIGGIQSASSGVAQAINAIQTAVTTVREQVTLTAAAIEEQTALTSEMSNGLNIANSGVSSLAGTISQMSKAMETVASGVQRTKTTSQALVA